MKKIVLLMAVAGLIFTGCAKNDCCLPNVMSASPNPLNLSGGYDSGTFSLSCPMSWTLLNKFELPDWIEVSDVEGTGNKNITVYVTPNEQPHNRSFTFVFLAANGDKLNVVVNQSFERQSFLTNEAPRWEVGDQVDLNAASSNTFVTDKNGKIFNSGKYTVGREESGSGSWFEYLEFEAPVEVGTQSGWIRTEEGRRPLFRFEIIKMKPIPPDDLMLWIVFQETANSPERRVVQ